MGTMRCCEMAASQALAEMLHASGRRESLSQQIFYAHEDEDDQFGSRTHSESINTLNWSHGDAQVLRRASKAPTVPPYNNPHHASEINQIRGQAAGRANPPGIAVPAVHSHLS